jgi:phage regulator Rha-like protein
VTSKKGEPMKNPMQRITVPDEIVINKIFVIRDVKVMVDRDLAELYGVETKVLKQSVRRNINRFPEDFMFEMTEKEFEAWRIKFISGSTDKKGLRYAPFCFTEQGVAMLSSILNSDRAIQVNIQIIRIFTKMRELMSAHKEILQKINQIEKKGIEHESKINLIFDYLKKLTASGQREALQKNRPLIGFRQK